MTDKQLPIVAIGASAGGVAALSTLFQHMPPDLGAAFVVVTHLAPDRVSLLPEILARCTALTVTAAQNGQAVQPDHIYLNPPDGTITLVDGHFLVRPRGAERNPIDLLFSSVAKAAGKAAIAAILSGTGHDGALGVKVVREAGGFTLAQGNNGEAPAHPQMPAAAIATGFVDNVLGLDEMAGRIGAYCRAIADGGDGDTGLSHTPETTLAQAKRDIYAALQYRVGHDFSNYKEKTFFRRVERRMQVRQVMELGAYVQLIKKEPEEASALFRDLLIGVTNFFRDKESFDTLETLVIPALFAGPGTPKAIRVWVPGCATGEEAFSLAILLCEGAERVQAQAAIQIFATDVDENALTVARAGRYPEPLLEGMTPERLARFFTREGSTYTVSKQIRNLCIFSSHSLIRDPPFSQIDLISCRNLLIYFNTDLQRQVIPLFHYALRPGGFLFLGASENLAQHGDPFTPLDKKRRIYQRRDIPPARPTLFPLVARGGAIRHPFHTLSTPPAHGGKDSLIQLERRLLEEFAPAHVLVNQDGDIVHYSTRTGKYFEAPAGLPIRNVLSLARKSLKLPLRSAFHQARQTGKRTIATNIAIEADGGTQTIDLIVDPLPDGDGDALWAIIFRDIGPLRGGPAVGALHAPADREAAVDTLEQELQQAREQLQTYIEEYETTTEELKSANEELLSVNEEMQSSNEELQTSKEELQSINEEMSTVNGELATKVSELALANNDLKNLFDSTRIATIFLDHKYIIRNFTPAMSEVFKLIPGDRGRPLSDIVSLIDDAGIETDVRTVLREAVPVERNVVSLDGQAHYLMRVVPYLAEDAHVEGAIITFVNVTELMRAQQRQHLLLAELNHRVKNMLTVVASLAQQLARRCTTIDQFTEGLVGRIQGLSRIHELLAANEWSPVALEPLVAAELAAFVENGHRLATSGPRVLLQPRAAVTIGMILYELATNATKYGALSDARGRLLLDWRLEDQGSAPHLVMTWREADGPPVRRPEKSGLGSELIERGLTFELNGTAVIDYRPKGAAVTLTIPATADNIQPEHPAS